MQKTAEGVLWKEKRDRQDIQYKNLLKTFLKQNSQTSGLSIEKVNQFIYERILQKLAIELSYKSKTGKLVLTGSLAKVMFEDLKPYMKNQKSSLDPDYQICQINSLRTQAWQ